MRWTSLLLVALCTTPAAALPPTEEGRGFVEGANHHLGDVSFVAAFGHAPGHAAEALRMAQEGLADVETAVAATEDARRQTGQWAREARDRLQIGRGRLAALRALQEAALGRHDGGLEQWLRGQGLTEAPRLAERLEVEPGW